jgi:hypothetical protein
MENRAERAKLLVEIRNLRTDKWRQRLKKRAKLVCLAVVMLWLLQRPADEGGEVLEERSFAVE